MVSGDEKPLFNFKSEDFDISRIGLKAICFDQSLNEGYDFAAVNVPLTSNIFATAL